MDILTTTESVCKYGALPALVLAIHETDENATAKDIARLTACSYWNITRIIKTLKAAGAWDSCEKRNFNSCEISNTCEISNFSQGKERKQEKENFPPYPPFKEKEINKEKDANNTTAININNNNAHTREEEQSAVIVSQENVDKTTGELIAIDQHAKKHPIMLEQFCMANYITPAVFAKLANEVATEWTLKGTTHDNDAEARNHFFNTIRQRAAELRRDQPKQRPLKLTWLPNEPLTLPADATDEERAAFLAEVDRRDKEYHKNDEQLPF